MQGLQTTHLPLARWAQICGIHPLHVSQVQLLGTGGTLNLQDAHCDSVWFTHDWQDSDRVGREQILQVIAEAERDIEEYLGYRLLPSWEVDEWQLTGGGLRTKWGHFVSGGVRAATLLGESRPITYSDEDNDDYDETGTVTATVASGQVPCEVALFYPDKGADERWRIRPVSVTVTGTTATITFRRELAVLEALLEAFEPVVVDGVTAGNFLTAVDVYRVWNDPQTQASFLWEPTGFCGCGSSACEQCAFATQAGCLMARNAELGILSYRPGAWNATDQVFDAEGWYASTWPQQARLYYYAGLRDRSLSCPNVEMDADWARTVAYYAASKLDRPPCGCRENLFDYWRQDLAFSHGSDEVAAYRLSPDDLGNPFGTRRGAIYAWKRVMRPRASAGVGAVVA